MPQTGMVAAPKLVGFFLEASGDTYYAPAKALGATEPELELLRAGLLPRTKVKKIEESLARQAGWLKFTSVAGKA